MGAGADTNETTSIDMPLAVDLYGTLLLTDTLF